MQIKKYEAPTIQEALDAIKRELGPEAIILQTKKNRKGFGLMSSGSVEVTVAVSDRSLHKKKFAETRMPEQDAKAVGGLPAERQAEVYDKMLDKHLARITEGTKDQVSLSPRSSAAQKPITATRYADIVDVDGMQRVTQGLAEKGRQAVDALQRTQSPAVPAARRDRMTLEEEIQHLKRMVSELKSGQEDTQVVGSGSGAHALSQKPILSTPALSNAYEQLVVSGVDKYYALTLIKQAQFALGDRASENPDAVLDQLAMEIMENTQVEPLLEGLVEGLARRDEPRPEGENPGPALIAVIGPTGVGKTTTLAKIASQATARKLRVGLINVDSYKVAAFDQIATYAKILNVPFRSVSGSEDLKLAVQDFKALDLVLIDTTGRSQKETESLQEMEKLLHGLPGIRTFLTLSVSTRDAELYEMGRRFSIFRPEALILSKLDEALLFGSIYNVSQRLKLPLAYFTTGQKVPDDLEEATRERLAALILDLQFGTEGSQTSVIQDSGGI